MKLKYLLAGLMIFSLALWAAPGVAAPYGSDTPMNLAQRVFWAINQGDVDSLAAVRDKGANLNITLWEAGLNAEEMFGFRASELFDTDADVDNWTPIFWAVYLQEEDILRVLLRSGALVNVVDSNGASPLHWAAWTGNYPIVKTLLENGADGYALDNKKRSPLDWALMTGQNDIIRILPPAKMLDSDGDGVADYKDECPRTPLGASVDVRGCWIAAYSSFFDFNKAVVKKQYYPYIKQQATVILRNPDLVVELAGHTDSVGTEEYNMELGMRRAEAVLALLQEFGVPGERLKPASFGETKPIASNRTARGRAQNRRVELHVWEPQLSMSE